MNISYLPTPDQITYSACEMGDVLKYCNLPGQTFYKLAWIPVVFFLGLMIFRTLAGFIAERLQPRPKEIVIFVDQSLENISYAIFFVSAAAAIILYWQKGEYRSNTWKLIYIALFLILARVILFAVSFIRKAKHGD